MRKINKSSLKRVGSLILCMIMAAALCGCEKLDYMEAVKLYEAGGYEGAKAAFEELGEYEDSAEYAAKAGVILDYDKAIELYAKGRYAEAKKIFAALGTYENSAEYLRKAEDKLMAEKIVGRWKTEEVDMTDIILAYVKESLAMAGYEDVEIGETEAFTVSAYYEFEEFGLVTEELDEESVNVIVGATVKMVKDFMVELTAQELVAAAEFYGVSLEDVLAGFGVSSVEEYLDVSMGMSFDEYLSSIFNEEIMDALYYSARVSGAWYVKDGELYVVVTDETEKGDYDADKDIITMLECEVSGENAELASGEEFELLYPYTMSRADEAKPKA